VKTSIFDTNDLSSLARRERGELVLDTALTYDGITPVRIRARKREGRFDFSDGGGAVAAAGADWRRVTFERSIAVGECSANVSRRGVVSLPGFTSSGDERLARLPELVAEGSLALYQALLALD